MPSTFASLRFSPLIIVALRDWPRLKDKQRTAIIDAVGSGTKLVISTGEGGKLPPNWVVSLMSRWVMGKLHKTH